ncbi:MAG: CapA family protein [Candidatus Lambdaproteobacteria bacterium]|nr:CapA family protein [Candidatus Lambdaproteobacteria bacterium]
MAEHDADQGVILMGCGDVGPIHEPMLPYSALVKPTLAAADIRFGQCERVYSERGSLQVHSGGRHSRLKPHLASVFSDCGFDVVSVASNHAMDWGEEALLDTLDVLRARGIQTVGAGRNIEEARRPALIERKGVQVAILAYCSIVNEGYAAGPAQAGVAPMRAHTYYEALEYQAGIPPRVVTVPHEADLAALAADIADAKRRAQVVVVSLHWGLHFIPRAIADYQPVVARAAFAAGADLILGGHAHVPKAVAVYGGKVCLYSLSNFIMTSPAPSAQRAQVFLERYGARLDPDYPHLPYGTDAKRSLIARAVLTRAGARRVSFLPVLIDRHLRPEVLAGRDPRFAEALAYMEWASEDFPHRFTVEGDEVVVNAP